MSNLNLADALATFTVKEFSLNLAGVLGHFFNVEKFASLLIKEVGNGEKEMSDSLKGWLNFSAGLTFDYFEKITGKPFYVNVLDSAKFIEKFPKLSPKTLLGIGQNNISTKHINSSPYHSNSTINNSSSTLCHKKVSQLAILFY